MSELQDLAARNAMLQLWGNGGSNVKLFPGGVYPGDSCISRQVVHTCCVGILPLCVHCRCVAGSLDGKIKVWRLTSGQCLRRFDHAHAQGVTCVALSRDGTQVSREAFPLGHTAPCAAVRGCLAGQGRVELLFALCSIVRMRP